MEPISIIGVVESALGLAFKCGNVAKSMKDIVARYKHAELAILATSQSLYSIQLPWNKIAEWLQGQASEHGLQDDDLLQQLEQCLYVGALVSDALHQEILSYQFEDAHWTFKQRVQVIWNETSLQEHKSRVRDQACSMTLLLQAIQL